MIMIADVALCECRHNILLHYLKNNSDEHGECIIAECKCQEYRALRSEGEK